MNVHVKWFKWSMTFPKKIAKICQALRLTCKVSSFHLHVSLHVSISSHRSLDSFLPNIESQPGKSYHPSIPKELEVMDSFNPDEPI
jgi:hypothetical protein